MTPVERQVRLIVRTVRGRAWRNRPDVSRRRANACRQQTLPSGTRGRRGDHCRRRRTPLPRKSSCTLGLNWITDFARFRGGAESLPCRLYRQADTLERRERAKRSSLHHLFRTAIKSASPSVPLKATARGCMTLQTDLA